MLGTTKFFTSDRNGKKALWAEVEGCSVRNIWDLDPAQVTPEVLRAIQTAFEIGAELTQYLARVRGPSIHVSDPIWSHRENP